MTQLIIDKKKYVILPVKEYEVLQKKAALKSKPEKLFSIDEARAYSKKLINKWSAGK
jgi:PHD/YefM family antitoxin component YafN of YafNO toxin-antitoxin module